MLKTSSSPNLRVYEGLFMYPPDSGPDAKKKQMAQLEAALKKFKGAVIDKVEMGKRLLGYQVRKFKEADMVVVNFEIEPESMSSFQNALLLEETILKFMITVGHAEPPKKAPKKKAFKATKHHPPRKTQEVKT